MPLCAYPFYHEPAGGLIPCGQCHQCRQKKRREKTTRVVLEGLTHEHALFVTLTYMDEYLPKEIYDLETGEVRYSHPSGCLDLRAVQLFLKRLRRNLPPCSIRTFYCGEYGDKNWRPHYHLILFGLPYKDRRYIYESWHDPVTKNLMCDPKRLDIQVPKSHWDVGQYVSSYVMKKMTSPKDDRLAGRSPEFSHSSKGIGLDFVNNYTAAMSGASGQNFIEFNGDIPRVILINGKKMPLDRYMRKKIIDALQITEVAEATGFAKYQEEMYTLRVNASQNEKVPKAWLMDARRLGWAMEKQYGYENAGALAVAESRRQFFDNKRKDL